MREGRRGGLDINSRQSAVSETKGLFGGHGHTDEFRPIEEVEADESLRGPGRHVDLNEISELSSEGEGGEFLTAEDRLTAELDRKRGEEKNDAPDEDENEGEDVDFFSEDIDKLANEVYEDSADEGGGPIVLDAPVKKAREVDIRTVRSDGRKSASAMSKKTHRQMTNMGKNKHPEKPKYKEVKRKTVRY